MYVSAVYPAISAACPADRLIIINRHVVGINLTENGGKQVQREYARLMNREIYGMTPPSFPFPTYGEGEGHD